jgi:hypothetical protein
MLGVTQVPRLPLFLTLPFAFMEAGGLPERPKPALPSRGLCLPEY